MEDIADRMRRITEDLRALQRALHEALVNGPVGGEEESSQPVELESLKDFKSAIDQMRHFLWFYIRAMSNECGAGEKMIELLRQASRASELPSDPDSLLESLNAVSDYAILHYPIPPNRKPN